MFESLLTSLRYIDLTTVVLVFRSLLSHVQSQHAHFLIKTSTLTAFMFLQHSRQRPRTEKEGGKHLPLRKQDVPTRTCALRKLRHSNTIKFFHNMCGNQKLGGHPKLFLPFDHPLISVFHNTLEADLLPM